MSEQKHIVRIPPYNYIHVLDKLNNITRLVIGPKIFICQEHESVVKAVQQMIALAAQDYCIIKNPVVKDASGDAVLDKFDQVKLQHGDVEYRFYQEPFPLYPGESLEKPATKLVVVLAEAGILLRAICDFTDENDVSHVSGELWVFPGPGLYKPRKEVEVVEKMSAFEIKPNSAIRLCATKTGSDALGVNRAFGEEWFVKRVGAYLRGPYEKLVSTVEAINLDEKSALRLKALQTHKDDFGQLRKQGTEWLVTNKMTEAHIPSVFEEVVAVEKLITLTPSQYCVILDPVDVNYVPQFGRKKLLRGECSFFVQPGESLESGIQSVYVLDENEALILRAKEQTENQQAGERWMITGPAEYVPPVEVEVMDRRQAIPLDENEGIYVRDMRTGRVRAVTGKTYILNQDEELWRKNIPPAVEKILTEQRDPLADRSSQQSNADRSPKALDLTRVITFQVPHNAAVQVYDYKEKLARVQFGPDLVMLGPDEQFTQLSLSGGKPKRPNMIKALCLLMGPDFCTDVVTVETADHARLSLQLSYNWHFNVSAEMSMAESAKLFSVPDFVGDSCKAIASRVRGTVASVQFDDFHKNSARIIRSSVFGLDENGKVREQFVFKQNNLVITSIDVQSVEPVDQRTRDALQKSVQLAIEITTNSQEATARHEAERLEQEARGRLERQKIEDEAAAEKSRRTLLELQVQSAALESTGQAKAEAQSRAEAARIEGQAAVEAARFKSESLDIEAEAELKRLKMAREAELSYLESKNSLQMLRRNEEMTLEVKKFSDMMKSLGADNLRAIACAGPNQDVRMLKALGLQSTLITDGASPINLLQTAQGLIGNAMGTQQMPCKMAKHCDTDGRDSDNDDDIDLA